MEVVGRGRRLRQRPAVSLAPVPAVVQIAQACPASAAAAHEEPSDGRHAGRARLPALEPLVEPVQMEAVQTHQRRLRSQIRIAGDLLLGGVGAVHPGTHDHLHRSLLGLPQGLEGLQRGAGVGVVPASDQEDGDVRVLLQELLDGEPGLFPELVVVSVPDQLQRPALVSREQRKLALPPSQRQPPEPMPKIGTRRQPLLQPGACPGFGVPVVDGVPEGPGQETELVGPALTNRAGVGVPAAHDWDHAG